MSKSTNARAITLGLLLVASCGPGSAQPVPPAVPPVIDGAPLATQDPPSVATAAPAAPPSAPSAGAPSADVKQGDRAHAQAMLQKFLAPGADRAALTRALQPTADDYAAVFGPNASKAQAFYDKMWADKSTVVEPKPGQTQLLVFESTTDAVAKSSEFPGGYAKAQLSPGLPIFAWKFVEPGKTSGMAFDGLVWVNGHFALFFKPWKATQ